MNYKKYTLATIAAIAFIFVFEFLVHNQMLSGMYADTADLWRPMEEMKFGFGMLIQVLTAALTVCFAKEYGVRNARDGAKFGLGLGLIMGVAQLGTYTFLPIPFVLAAIWFVAVVVKMTGLGAIAGAIYKD